MERSQLPTVEREVVSGSTGSAGSEVEGEEIFHTPRRSTVRGPVSSGTSGRGKHRYERSEKARERASSASEGEDLLKRKRDSQESPEKSAVESPFKRSVRTRRSPHQKMEGQSEKEALRMLIVEIRGLREDVRGTREQMESMREDLRIRDEKWEKEVKELREKVEGLEREVVSVRKEREVKIRKMEEEIRVWKERAEKRLEMVESRSDMEVGDKGEGEKKGIWERVESMIEEKVGERRNEKEERADRERIRAMELRMERKEKADRRNNIVIRGLKLKSGEEREGVETLLQSIGWVKGNVGKVRLEGRKENEVAVVELESWEEKLLVMQNKSRIKDKKVFIDQDLTRKEREVQRMLNERARRERSEGRAAKTLQNRRIRIEISNSSNDERRGGRMGRDNRRDGGFEDSEQRTSGDWRSGPRDDAPSDGDRYRGRGGFENRDRDRDRKDDREETDNTPGMWRSSGDGGRPAFKDRGGEDRERDWGSSRYGGDRGSRDRDGDRDRERGGSSFGPRRNYGGDSTWDRDRTQSKPSASDIEPAEPRIRPKLQLQPRTKPVEPIVVKEEVVEEPAASPAPAASVPTPVPATNIFGAAKPVDTAAREREIEERLNKTYAEPKAKEESEVEKRSAKEGGAWGKRNGEGRDDKEKPKPTWRSEDDRGRQSERRIERNNPPSRSDQRGDSKGPPVSLGGLPPSRGSTRQSETRAPPLEREKKEKDRDERDEISRMPKAKEEQAPNFVASNKYCMLPDDVDPDNIED